MQIVSWLKQDFGLGHGHAMAVYSVLTDFKTIKSGPPPEFRKQKAEKASMKAHATNIDEYLSLQPAKSKAALEKLHKIILSVAPDAEEVISYAMPAFKYHGMLVGFAGWKNHSGFYPWNSRTIAEFKDELKGYETSKGAIQFPLNKPIPVALVKKIVKARMKENELKSKK